MGVHQERGPCSQFVHHYCLAHPHELDFWQEKALWKHAATAKYWGLSNPLTLFPLYWISACICTKSVYTTWRAAWVRNRGKLHKSFHEEAWPSSLKAETECNYQLRFKWHCGVVHEMYCCLKEEKKKKRNPCIKIWCHGVARGSCCLRTWGLKVIQCKPCPHQEHRVPRGLSMAGRAGG